MPRLVQYRAIKRRIHVSLYRWLSKLASTFILALVEEKLTPLNSLLFFYTNITKDFGEQVKWCLHFTVECRERKSEA